MLAPIGTIGEAARRFDWQDILVCASFRGATSGPGVC
jgi:hypothetical protein